MDVRDETATIPTGGVLLPADLLVPAEPVGAVLFAHGSGSSRHSPRNVAVARTLNRGGFGTVLVDLLTAAEEEKDAVTAELRFDIGLLADRLVHVTGWLRQSRAAGLPVGYFGASTGAAAALWAAAEAPNEVVAVVSRGGRPDLAGPRLPAVQAPTLLIVGGRDEAVLELNREAMRHLRCEKTLEIVPGATHLFQEPGALETVAAVARDWFLDHFTRLPV